MTAVETPPLPARQERLRTRVSALRTRAAGTGDRDRRLLVVGALLLPLGVLLVLLGWLGVARTPLVFEQVPYVVSGGMLGLALVVIGGFVYFSYWQTLVVRALKENQDRLGDSLDRIEQLLAAQAEPGVSLPHQPSGALVATATGTMLHRADCAVVLGRERLRPVTSDTRGLTPCSLCHPLDA